MDSCFKPITACQESVVGPNLGFKQGERPLRVLFLGNSDNMNLRLCLWSQEFGVDATLWRLDEDPFRGNPADIDPHLVTHPPEWFQSYDVLNHYRRFACRRGELVKEAERNYDLVVVSGWRGLIASASLRLPKVLVPVGSEIGQLPYFYKQPVAGIRQYIDNCLEAFLGRRALRRVDLIQETWPLYTDMLTQLGHRNKLLYMSIGEDCARCRDDADPQIRAELADATCDAERVFLWFSRLNFRDSSSRIYKGPERFIKALESHLDRLKSGKLKVFMGKHGDEHQAFVDEVVAQSPVAPYITWVPHLGRPSLLAYLQNEKAVLFSGFGRHNCDVPGIARDAIGCSTVMVNSATEEQTARQYGQPMPRFYALEVEEIAAQMERLCAMPAHEFAQHRQQVADYAANCVDYRVVLPRFYENVRERLKL